MSAEPAPAAQPRGLSSGLTLLFALACGLCVANIYFAQPLIGPIAATLQLPAGLAGLIMTLTQLGYGAGLLLLVPLADVMENRRLITLAMGGEIVVLGPAGERTMTLPPAPPPLTTTLPPASPSPTPIPASAASPPTSMSP